MDDREREPRGVGRAAADDRLVRLPAGAGHDRGLRGHERRARDRDSDLGAPQEERAQPRHRAGRAVLDPARRARPVRAPEPPGGKTLALGASRRSGRPPPPARRRARRSSGRSPSPCGTRPSPRPPVQADEVEAKRRRCAPAEPARPSAARAFAAAGSATSRACSSTPAEAGPEQASAARSVTKNRRGEVMVRRGGYAGRISNEAEARPGRKAFAGTQIQSLRVGNGFPASLLPPPGRVRPGSRARAHGGAAERRRPAPGPRGRVRQRRQPGDG